MTVRVSIVIANHDYERYVGAAIESALVQTHDDVEVVVVDDGSTDGSRAVIRGYANRVRTVFQANGGQASAVNAGFRASTGDVVVFLDADDLLEPHAASVVARLAAGGAAKVHWPLTVIDGDGRRTGAVWPAGELPDGDLRDRLLECPDYLTPPQSGNAYARWVLDAVLPMPEADFVTGADTYLFLLAPAFGDVRRSPEPLGRYRRHDGNNFTGRSFDARMEQLRHWSDVTLDALAETCERRGVPADPAAWRRTLWVYRVSRAARRLDAVVRQGTPFVLIDGGDWAMEPDGRRRPIPFVEHDGRWWGLPADDATAISELERLRARGARYAVFAFAAFWWFDHYAGFAAHLDSTFERVEDTDDLVVFDLAGRP